MVLVAYVLVAGATQLISPVLREYVVQAFRMEKQLENWYSNCLEERQAWTVRAARLARGTGAWLSIFDGITQWLVFGLGGASAAEA